MTRSAYDISLRQNHIIRVYRSLLTGLLFYNEYIFTHKKKMKKTSMLHIENKLWDIVYITTNASQLQVSQEIDVDALHYSCNAQKLDPRDFHHFFFSFNLNFKILIACQIKCTAWKWKFISMYSLWAFFSFIIVIIMRATLCLPSDF